MIDSGEIGKPVIAQINAFEAFNPDAGHPRHWFIEKAKSGGGPMMDFGCHRLEVLTSLFGSVERLESLTANVVFEREVEDTASVLMQFASGDVRIANGDPRGARVDGYARHFRAEGSLHVASLNSGETADRDAVGSPD